MFCSSETNGSYLDERLLEWQLPLCDTKSGMLLFYHIGRYLLLMRRVFTRPDKTRIFVRALFEEAVNIGLGSFSIVAIISTFTGAVFTVQTAYQLTSGLFPPSVIGSIVSDNTILELAPTITMLALAGRIGSSVSTEIGTMRVSEQIDALDVMGINSANYLILPKILSGLFMLPLLIIIAMGLSISSGFLVGDLAGIVSPQEFLKGARESFRPYSFFFAMVKVFTFSFVITSIPCYEGYYTTGGALGVGRSSTRAVVYSSVGIVFFDYFLASILL